MLVLGYCKSYNIFIWKTVKIVLPKIFFFDGFPQPSEKIGQKKNGFASRLSFLFFVFFFARQQEQNTMDGLRFRAQLEKEGGVKGGNVQFVISKDLNQQAKRVAAFISSRIFESVGK